MLRFFLALILILTIMPISAQQEPVALDWSEKWDFREDLVPISVKVDYWNNIYAVANVFTNNGTNILLLKYGANKTLLWAKEFDNGDNEIVSDMVVRGHAVYLAGKANKLLLVMKYGSDGELRWARYAEVQTTGLPSIDVDANFVYVALGNWMVRHDKTDGKVSQTFKLGEDGKVTFDVIEVYGNSVYVVGQPADSFRIVVQKHDISGNMIWNITRVSKWAEGARDISLYHGMMYITGIQGNVIIEKDKMKGIADLLLLRYDTDGNLVWEKTWGTNSTLEWGFSGKIYKKALYVVGLTSSDYALNGTSTILQKYDADGDMEWGVVRNEMTRGVSLDVKRTGIFLLGSHQNNMLIQQYIQKE